MGTEKVTDMGNEGSIEIGLDTLVINGDPTKLYEELAKAQAEFLPVPKASTGQVGNQKFKYAGYAKLMRCVRPALSAHGIIILQPLHSREDLAVTTTILAGHGASIVSSFSFKSDFSKKDKNGVVTDDPQEFGRHHTYYRRYQLQAMLGLEGDADADDLPDVNEEPAQYKEPKRDPTTGEAVPAKAPKELGTGKPAQDSAEKKPVAAKESKTNGSAKSSEPSTASSEKKEPAQSVKTLTELITMGMKQLNWKVADVRSFYTENVDPAGFDKADNLTVDQRKALFDKMVELKDVTPF